MKILIEANVKNKKNLENTSGLILSLKDYSVQSSITYTLEEIKEIVKTNPTLEIFINLNKNFFNDEIFALRDKLIEYTSVNKQDVINECYDVLNDKKLSEVSYTRLLTRI